MAELPSDFCSSGEVLTVGEISIVEVRCRPAVVSWRRTRWMTAGFHGDIASFRRILGMLRSDPAFLAFHEGHSIALPEFYRRAGERAGPLRRTAVRR